MDDLQLVERFKADPERGYHDLLERYSTVILRMIRRFMRDPDEVMEVYTSICERFQAHDYQALRSFSGADELAPWLSVVVANACRDRFRKRKATSTPQSVIDQLDEKERLVFKYFYQEHLPHEDIAEIISRRHRVPYSAMEVVKAVARINDLLSTRKRWLLLSALRANSPTLSLDALEEEGYQPIADEEPDEFVRIEEEHRRLEVLADALQRLESEDRLLVKLWYEHHQTGPQIAAILGYENYRHVYTRLRTVVGRLRRYMGLDES